MDMNGNIVHAWLNVRAIGRIRLNQKGELLATCTDNFVRKFDWDGNLLWEFNIPIPDTMPHHDLIFLENNQ